MQIIDGIARRCRLDMNVPAELSIREAILSVERAGCHPLLTEAVVLLGHAKDKVADYVENPVKSWGAPRDANAKEAAQIVSDAIGEQPSQAAPNRFVDDLTIASEFVDDSRKTVKYSVVNQLDLCTVLPNSYVPGRINTSPTLYDYVDNYLKTHKRPWYIRAYVSALSRIAKTCWKWSGK